MDSIKVYSILRDIVGTFALSDPQIKTLPESINSGELVSQFGLDIVSLPEILEEFQNRFQGKDLRLGDLLSPETLNALTLGRLLVELSRSLKATNQNRITVYVDDEEENLFVFKRKFGRQLRLQTFTDPVEALTFICNTPDVGLIITDEVMPKLSGSMLCEEVKKVKPNLKFILITGNPNHDNDLLYTSLRKNRFYEFINKPVDFDAKGEEYLAMIQGLLDFDW
jgi:CheY-like chemotaxis protein